MSFVNSASSRSQSFIRQDSQIPFPALPIPKYHVLSSPSHRRQCVKRLLTFAAAIIFSVPVAAQNSSPAPANPKVRAITAFVRLDRSTWDKQIHDTLAVLRSIQRDFIASGYEVETLRIVTQPIGELVAGLSE